MKTKLLLLAFMLMVVAKVGATELEREETCSRDQAPVAVVRVLEPSAWRR